MNELLFSSRWHIDILLNECWFLAATTTPQPHPQKSTKSAFSMAPVFAASMATSEAPEQCYWPGGGEKRSQLQWGRGLLLMGGEPIKPTECVVDGEKLLTTGTEEPMGGR